MKYVGQVFHGFVGLILMGMILSPFIVFILALAMVLGII